MHKKHFIALADVIRIWNNAPLDGHAFSTGQIDEIADFLKSQNGMFNRERWLAYIAGECGPNGGRPSGVYSKA